ncbi:MAG: hypothetical protein ACK5NC_11220 [Vibrio sp.]
MTLSKPRILPFMLLPLAALLGFYAPTFFKAAQTTVNEQPSLSELPTDLSQYCVLSTQVCQQNNVSISMDSDIAKPLAETKIQIDWPKNSSKALTLTLQGLEMDLGIVKFSVPKTQDGDFRGSIILPVCTFAKMTWIGTLTDEQGQQIYTSIRMEK